MRRASRRASAVISRRVTVVMVAMVLVVVSAGVAFAGTVTTPTGNPFVVPGNASGNPVAFTIVATGYTPGSLVSVEQCDGVATSDPHWSPTANCDLATSPAPVLADATGKATFTASDPNHGFVPFKGESPQSLFNCLSPNGPALNAVNGLTDYRNCKIRVSTNNNVITADQAFLNIRLPEAVAGTTTTTTTSTSTSTSTTSTSTSTTSTTTTVPQSTTTTTVPQTGTTAGSCSGAQLLAKVKGTDTTNLGFTDQTQRVKLTAALMTDLGSKTKIAGTCSGLVVPSDNLGGPIPATLHPKAIGLALSGLGSCASTAAAKSADASKASAYALSGVLTITMNELDASVKPKPFKVQAYVTVKGFDPAKPDLVQFTGVVKAGASLGATVSGKLYLDALAKITPALKPPSGTGYQYDATTASHCTDGIANNASMLQAQMGDGTSLAGTTGVPGLSFSYTSAAAATSAAGSCSGAQLLGKVKGTDTTNLGFTDQTQRVTLSAAAITNLATKAKIVGTCSALKVPSDNLGGAIPATLHPKSVALKLSGFGSCASSAAAVAADAAKGSAYALSGVLTITMNELDASVKPKPFKVQAYVTARFDAAATDVLQFTGVVKAGASLGATVSGKLYLDALAKITPALKPPSGTGYQYDSTTASHCTDGIANNASMLQAQLGEGTSLAATTGVSGLSFGYSSAT